VVAVAVVVVVAGQESYIDFMRFPDLRNQLGRWDIRTMLTAKKQKNKLCLLCFKRWELNGTNNTSVSKKCPKRSYPAHIFSEHVLGQSQICQVCSMLFQPIVGQ
jgi:hypothetical protein